MTATTLDRINGLVASGDADMATIEAIRAVDAWWPADGDDRLPRPALADALNTLGVLRHRVGDLQGAAGSFRAAVAFDPSHPDAAANLAGVEPELAAVVPPEIPNTDADALNPWAVDVLAGARALVDFAGKVVVEIGGALPREAVDPLGVARWVGCDPRCDDRVDDWYEVRGADAGALPLPDDSADVVFSSCAFEHFDDVPGVLAEARRVLRPGGVLVADYGPLWTHAHGHHLVEVVDGRLLWFVDPVVPNWAHLTLGRHQLARFIALGWGVEAATAVDRRIFENDEDNHLPEADHRRAFHDSGLQVELLEGHGWAIEPGPSMRAELEQLHPDGSDFTIYSYRVLLRKPDPTTPTSSSTPPEAAAAVRASAPPADRSVGGSPPRPAVPASERRLVRCLIGLDEAALGGHDLFDEIARRTGLRTRSLHDLTEAAGDVAAFVAEEGIDFLRCAHADAALLTRLTARHDVLGVRVVADDGGAMGWDDAHPDVLELHLEDLVGAPRTHLAMIFRFLGLDVLAPLDELLALAARHEIPPPTA